MLYFPQYQAVGQVIERTQCTNTKQQKISKQISRENLDFENVLNFDFAILILRKTS